MANALRIPNVGAEEPGGPEVPAARQVGALWSSLFDPPPALDLLPGDGSAVAWLNTEAAAAEANERGLPLAGAAPACVARVHDKAFALHASEAAGLVPECLRDIAAAWDADALRAPDAIEALASHVAGWPAWARERFTLKPRFGGAGRGRVAGRDGTVDNPEIRGALPRLAAAGGVVLEPWLARRADLSAIFWLAPDAPPRLLGTTDQHTAPSGLYLGANATVDSRGRVAATSRHDEAARELALPIVTAAADAGYHGPLGVDLFAFATPDDETALRISEVNARYTVGFVAVGLARRALPALRERLGLAPGGLVHMALRLSGAAPALPDGLLVHPLESDGPYLAFARDADTLAAAMPPAHIA